MDFELPPAADARRMAVRDRIVAHPSPSGPELAGADAPRNIVAERVLGLPHDVDGPQGPCRSEAQEVGVR